METVTLFVCGDVMTGRGIDQILPHPGDPSIPETYMKSAAGYLELAERANGPIPKPANYSYIWGDALDELQKFRPDMNLINLETSITTRDYYWPGKGINYRMHPLNTPCLTAARIDVCALANNHVLDWGYAGLSETLAALKKENIQSAGAGKNLEEAQQPVILKTVMNSRVLIFSCGHGSSGIPGDWAADEHKPGVWLVKDLSDQTVEQMQRIFQKTRRPGDIVVVSIHWSDNWGFTVNDAHIQFAHELIDRAGADIIHGHSSHHIRGIDVYKGRPILYGCGDFLNDYEGLCGYEEFRGDLALMYFITMNAETGKLVKLTMTPTQTRRFQVKRALPNDAEWIKHTLNREGKRFGTRVEFDADFRLGLHWS